MSFVGSMRNEGFAIVETVFDDAAISRFVHALSKIAEPEKGRGGVRNLLDIEEMRELAYSVSIQKLVTPILGEDAFAVRGILFDKNDGANWKVPWHQDVTIAVKHRVEAEGYGPWSMKQGVLHVQPPTSVLDKMVSVRCHLDDCPATNGALRVIPRSHAHGKLSQESIAAFAANNPAVVCEAKRGDVLLMRPLTIHSSSASEVPRHRRVIHFDYANVELAAGMEWQENEKQRPVS